MEGQKTDSTDPLMRVTAKPHSASSSCSPPADVCSARPCNSTRCQLLTDVCIVNETIHHRPQRGGSWTLLKASARLPWNSHQILRLDKLNADSHPELPNDLGALTMRQTVCAPPIAFVPAGSLNYADTFLSTVVPLMELEQNGLITPNRATQLILDVMRKHMHASCRSNLNTSCHTPGWLHALVEHVSPITFMHELAPTCGGGTFSTTRCVPQCFTHVRYCNLRSIFDRQPSTLDAWSLAQKLAARVLSRHDYAASFAAAASASAMTDVAGDEAGEALATIADPDGSGRRRNILRVLFERRVGKGISGRRLANADSLVELCEDFARRHEYVRLGKEQQRQPLEPGVVLDCTPHQFGKAGLAADFRRVRTADVLVGMHGTGLTHAFFMRRRSTVIEVRPYGFGGALPDSYFRNILKLAPTPKIYHMILSMGSPELCHPSHPAITIKTATYATSCTLPWRALLRALRVIAWWRQPGYGPRPKLTSEERYTQSSWASRNIWAYVDDLEPNGIIRASA